MGLNQQLDEIVLKPPSISSPQLIVTIDTEEEGLWTNSFCAQPPTDNLRGIERFQKFCEARKVLPTYLIDAPVVMDDWTVKRLRKWQEDGQCEVGAHCHPWCNPPLDGKPITGRSTFMCNLDETAQRQKLEWLTDKIESTIGRRPTSFRAGRYGLDNIGASVLCDLGYIVDSSVLPFRSYADEGGPDFRDAQIHPYRICNSNLLESDRSGKLIEIPVTAGFTKSAFIFRNRIRRTLTETRFRHFRLAGILDRLNLIRPVKLSPEQTSTIAARQLIDAAMRDGVNVLVLMFHSSSLLPGYSPYVKTEADLEGFYRWLDDIFSYCRCQKGCQYETLTSAATTWIRLNEQVNGS